MLACEELIECWRLPSLATEKGVEYDQVDGLRQLASNGASAAQSLGKVHEASQPSWRLRYRVTNRGNSALNRRCARRPVRLMNAYEFFTEQSVSHICHSQDLAIVRISSVQPLFDLSPCPLGAHGVSPAAGT